MDNFFDILVTPDDFVVKKDEILKIHNNVTYNKIIIDYYKKLLEEDKKLSINRINAIDHCNDWWKLDVYDRNQVKDFIRTNLCKDKFCNNCKKLKQACRMSRYVPELEKYDGNLYHITFTLPNVVGEELKDTIKHMSKCFKQLINYINLHKTLSFVDFSKYGYKGCVRSLEITFKNDSYHPHFHCAFVFDNLELDKKIINSYSIDHFKNRGDRLFSEFEIVLQKIWRLLIEKKRVSKENFESLDIGYSVICDKFDSGDYIELFKYMTKETDELSNILTYDNFKIIYYATYYVRQIQGYGCLYNITDDGLDEELDRIYIEITDFLRSDEVPYTEYKKPYELLTLEHYKVISRKTVYQYLKMSDKKDE